MLYSAYKGQIPGLDKKRDVMKNLLAYALLSFAAMSANAAITSADFRTEADLPTAASAGALVHERLSAALASGLELDGSDYVSNPAGWRGGEVWLDLDSSTNVLSLFSQDTWDFQTLLVTITNISGANITGIELITNGLTSPGLVPQLSYTANSVSILYSNLPDAFDFTGGTATFALLTDATVQVPEPQVALLFGAGFALLAFARRRRV